MRLAGLHYALVILTLRGSEALQCYQCDSQMEECTDDAEHRGKLVTCGSAAENGCYIVEALGGESAVTTRGCTTLAEESQYTCGKHTAGEQVTELSHRRSPSVTATGTAVTRTGILLEMGTTPH